jgi:hypothetical protein
MQLSFVFSTDKYLSALLSRSHIANILYSNPKPLYNPEVKRVVRKISQKQLRFVIVYLLKGSTWLPAHDLNLYLITVITLLFVP